MTEKITQDDDFEADTEDDEDLDVDTDDEDENIDDCDNNDDEDNDEVNEALKDKSKLKFKISDLDVALLLQKTNRILSSDEKIIVTSSPMLSAPACANPSSSSIMINFFYAHNLRTIKTIFDYMILVKGLNYHELAHILFTDYNSNRVKEFLTTKYDKTGNNIRIGDFLENINLLEDCRIEDLFYMLYPRARFYFNFCASNIILKDLDNLTPSQLLSSYLVLYGRKFLIAEERYKNPIIRIKNKVIKDLSEATATSRADLIIKQKKYNEIIEKCESIVDKFIVSKSLDERFELTYELTILLNNDELKLNLKSTSSTESVEHGKPRKGMKKRVSDAIDKLKEELEKQKKKQEQNEKGKSQEQKKKEEKEKKQGEKSDENKNANDIFKDIFEDIKEEVQKSAQIQDEVKNEIKTLGAGDKEFGSFSGEVATFEKSISESKKIENVLRRLRGDLATQVFRFQKKGRVDILSAIKSQKSNTLSIFKKQKINKVDKSKLGVSILLDTSGSISPQDYKNEISASWCLIRALEKLNNKAEIIEFSSNFRILKKFDNEGDWKRTFCSGTSIRKPFEQSVKDLLLLRREERIQNLFTIIISDGCFDESPERLKPLFDNAKKQGIKIIWIFASSWYDAKRKTDLEREVDWFIPIQNLYELSPKLNSIIRDIQKSINKQILTQDSFFGA